MLKVEGTRIQRGVKGKQIQHYVKRSRDAQNTRGNMVKMRENVNLHLKVRGNFKLMEFWGYEYRCEERLKGTSLRQRSKDV